MVASLTNAISIENRGFQFGDGIFETIALRRSQIDSAFLNIWTYHYHRIQRGCKTLGFAVPSEDMLLEILQSYAEQTPTPCIVKLFLTRKPSSRHAPIHWGEMPEIAHCRQDWPGINSDFAEHGVAVRTSEITLASQRVLAGLKHLNRLEYILAGQKICKNFPEHVLCDQSGLVIEGTKTNLFCCIDGQWLTPDLSEAGVAGVARAILLELLNQQITVKVDKLPREHLSMAREIFLCNSVIGIWPVRALDGVALSVGQFTQQCQRELEGIFQTCA